MIKKNSKILYIKFLLPISNRIKDKYNEGLLKDESNQSKRKTKKLVVMISRGELLLSVVLHIVHKFYGGEYDPLYVERIKQTLFLMFDEKLLELMDHNYNKLSLSTLFHAVKFVNKTPPMHIRVPNKQISRKTNLQSSRGKFLEDGKDHSEKSNHQDNSEEQKHISDNHTRFSLIRGSELMSHKTKDQKHDYGTVPQIKNSDSSSNLDQLSNFEDSKSNIGTSMKAPLDSTHGKRSTSLGAKNKNANSSFEKVKLESQHSSIVNNGTRGRMNQLQPLLTSGFSGKIYHYL